MPGGIAARRIAVVGAGALGGYVGGYLAEAGHDVTLIDGWPEHIETIRARGLELDGVTPEEQFTVRRAKTLHLTEVQGLAKQAPIDIAFVAVKSYDTEWATMLIKPYLAPTGFVVSLQNCLNEEKIAAIVGWGRTVGVIASVISVDMFEPGRIRRTVSKGGERHTVFRIGEVHGRITQRVEALVEMFKPIDSAKATTNLWGERWSKLCMNGMRNGVSAATGLTSTDCDRNPAIRRFAIQLGAEGVAVGQALGYVLEKIGPLTPDLLARVAQGDRDALAEADRLMTPGSNTAAPNPRANIQRPSMAQDMIKGRRTEIEFMNGFIAEKGAEIGIAAPSHLKLTDVVKRVWRGELAPGPATLGG
jgi:2-dehydropantoate 2-reductase